MDDKKEIIGKRVVLETLMKPGKFPGFIMDIDFLGHCTVKLDTQENPVHGVLYYEEEPGVINSSLWQFCYPLKG